MYGSLCYDEYYAKSTDPKFYCPFSLDNSEYMWIDEFFQQQKPGDNNMTSKHLSSLTVV
jgi:hypothetical protein